MTNKDLIEMLLTHEPTAQVAFMTTRAQPFENYVAGVVSRAEMEDQIGRVDAGVHHNDIFLVVGRRIRPGSLSAWILAERNQALRSEEATGAREAAVGAILRNYYASLFEGDAHGQVWEQSAMVRGLHAAYAAGAANRAAHLAADAADDIGASNAGHNDITRNIALPERPALGAGDEEDEADEADEPI